MDLKIDGWRGVVHIGECDDLSTILFAKPGIRKIGCVDAANSSSSSSSNSSSSSSSNDSSSSSSSSYSRKPEREVRLTSRQGKDWSDYYRPLAEDVERSVLKGLNVILVGYSMLHHSHTHYRLHWQSYLCHCTSPYTCSLPFSSLPHPPSHTPFMSPPTHTLIPHSIFPFIPLP